MSTKHTPGPWTVVEGNYPDRFGTSNALNVDHPCIYGEPDARLIAAAPEMLEALENALGGFNEKECNCDGEYTQDGLAGHACYFHRIEQDIRDAIAKATGGEE